MQISNTVNLGVWLHEQYLRHGVQFRLNMQVVSANSSNTGEIISLDILGYSENFAVLECDKIVLAAGGCTPAVFKKLFPESSTKFELVISAGE